MARGAPAGIFGRGGPAATDNNLELGGGGGGTIGGTGSSPQVAYFTAADTIGGEAGFEYDDAGNTLTVDHIRTEGTTGSASDPGYGFQGGSSGMYSLNANTIGFSTGGTLAVSMDAQGVGVGTSNPITAWTYQGQTAATSSAITTSRELQRTTGTAADGFGIDHDVVLEDNGGTDQTVAKYETSWGDVSAAKARVRLYTRFDSTNLSDWPVVEFGTDGNNITLYGEAEQNNHDGFIHFRGYLAGVDTYPGSACGSIGPDITQSEGTLDRNGLLYEASTGLDHRFTGNQVRTQTEVIMEGHGGSMGRGELLLWAPSSNYSLPLTGGSWVASSWGTGSTLQATANVTGIVAGMDIRGPELDTDSPGTSRTVDNAATLYIASAPSAASVDMTITNSYALFVDAGLSRFDGDGTHVFELPADATDPTGGGGAATGRIPVKIGGATVYLAYY